MNAISRREMLKALTITGVSTILSRPGFAVTAQKSTDHQQIVASKLTEYFTKTAPALLRPAQGILSHPTISPSLQGKKYSTNLWDWDTLWTTRGLYRLAHLTNDQALQQKISEHARGSLLVFLSATSADGRIPMKMTVEDADPLGCLKPGPTPNPNNQAKPVFAQLALLVADETNDVHWLAPHFDRILKFHDSWVRNNQSHVGLLVWGNDVAIGNDNDPATYGRPWFSSANLLLNTLWYRELQAAAELSRRLDRHADSERLLKQAEVFGASLLKYCWDPRDHFFYTVDTQCVDWRDKIPGRRKGMAMSWNCLPLKVQSFTGFLPMWAGLATQRQADELVHANYRCDDRFRCAGGVRTLSSKENMYSLVFSSGPSNWLGPVWIIVNYFVWQGLKNYGFHDEASDLGSKTVRLLEKDLETHGSLNEYYHPDTGEALSHPGFMDWNLLALEML